MLYFRFSLAASTSLGGAHKCIELANEHLSVRKAFGKALNSNQVTTVLTLCRSQCVSKTILKEQRKCFLVPLLASQSYVHQLNEISTFFQQYLQFQLAEMATKLVTSRLIVRQAARLLDEKHSSSPAMCAMAKLHATDNCFEVNILQI